MNDSLQVSPLRQVYQWVQEHYPELSDKHMSWLRPAITECIRCGIEIQEIIAALLSWINRWREKYEAEHPQIPQKREFETDIDTEYLIRENPDIDFAPESLGINNIVLSPQEWDIYMYILSHRWTLISLHDLLQELWEHYNWEREWLRKEIGWNIKNINQKLKQQYPELLIQVSVSGVMIWAINPEHMKKISLQGHELTFLWKLSKIIVAWQEKVLSEDECMVLWLLLSQLHTDGVRENRLKGKQEALEILAWKLSPIKISHARNKYFLNK